MKFHVVVKTNYHCPICGKTICEIRPPIDSWRYWCPFCNNLVKPKEKMKEVMKKLNKNTIGVVIAVKAPFPIEQVEEIRKKLEESKS